MPPFGFRVMVTVVGIGVGAAACVTLIIRCGTPGAVIVTVPLLAVVLVLTAAFILNAPFPVLFAGVTLVTVSHVALLLGTAHVALEVTVIS